MKSKKNEYLNEGILDVELAAEQEEIKSRKFKYGTLATVLTVIFIIAVILINIFAGYMTDRFVWEVDMTRERLFEISEDTKEVLADLNEPITITVLAEETAYRDAAPSNSGSVNLLGNIYEILQRYETLAGGKITVRYINPNLNPKIVEQYNTLGNIYTNDIIIESSKRFKKLSPHNLYSAKTDERTGTTYYVGLRAEQRITSALLFVTSDQITKAAYIRGHNEMYNVDELDTLLNYANYEITNINLLREDIPEDVTLIIIDAPTRDFTTDEIKKLDAYFERGGDALIAMTPNVTDELKNLSLFFLEWGVRYQDQVIFDSRQSHSGFPSYVIPEIKIFEGITGNLQYKNHYAMIPGALSIELTQTQASTITVTVLMTSSETSYAKPVDQATMGYDQKETDAVGPFNMTVLSERLVADKNLNYIRSSILFCNVGMITESVLETSAFLNRDYLGACLNYISEYSEGIVIPDKNFESTVLTIRSWQANLIFWVFLIGIPALIIVLSIIVWVRRRHL